LLTGVCDELVWQRSGAGSVHRTSSEVLDDCRVGPGWATGAPLTFWLHPTHAPFTTLVNISFQ